MQEEEVSSQTNVHLEKAWSLDHREDLHKTYLCCLETEVHDTFYTVICLSLAYSLEDYTVYTICLHERRLTSKYIFLSIMTLQTILSYKTVSNLQVFLLVSIPFCLIDLILLSSNLLYSLLSTIIQSNRPFHSSNQVLSLYTFLCNAIKSSPPLNSHD